MVIVYSKSNCSFCTRAKALLEDKGIAFTEVRVDEDPVSMEFLRAEGHRSVPQIYRDGALLVEGGYTGLSQQPESFFHALKGE